MTSADVRLSVGPNLCRAACRRPVDLRQSEAWTGGPSERKSALTISGTTSRPTRLIQFRKADRKAYAAAYARPGRLHAGWAYFVSFLQAAKDFAQLSQTRLTMPVLTIGGDKSLGETLGQQAKLVATDATVVMLKNTGHWVLEEQPKETTEALLKFL